ncbi:MBL fold metallo-hydrolase [candidate division KSB1 bacterium]|nr:MAG: MBL fold metallo-hydrolase [candidate division KSB1 bacterium]
MIIRCYGSRGSTPVSGEEYLKYGGDTTCVEIRTIEDDIIIVDAGSGIRKLGNKLIEEKIRNIHLIFTHAHWDHLMGLPFFKPIYFNSSKINIYGCPFTQENVKDMVSSVMKPPFFPVKFSEVSADISLKENCRRSFKIGSIKIESILISHPNQGLGYKFIERGKCFVFIPDNELSFLHPGGLGYKDYVEFSSGADLLIHDAEYTEEEYKSKVSWGHSIYTDALKLALDAKVKKFGLFHHNQDRVDNELDSMVDNCKKLILEKDSELDCFAVSDKFEIEI